MSKFCCQCCFTEKNVVQFILDKGISRGYCDYCGRENIKAVESKLIFEFIEKFDYGLEENVDGLDLFYILKDLIYFFEDDVIDKKALFIDIVDTNTDILDKKYKVPDSTAIHQSWAAFSEEIKNKNRFFPQTEIYNQIFSPFKNIHGSKNGAFNTLVESLKKTYPNMRSFYRARVHEFKLAIDQMKAPPPENVTAGRANPIGIPYLYLAENEQTCVSEVRPSNGCMVNIAEFRLNAGLSILDLTNPRKKASFLIQDSEDLTDTLIYIDLLEIFAKELSKPVLPNRSHLDYIPTQFLCEYFKTVCGFNGLIFNSSFGYGINLVLFDQSLVENVGMKYVSISQTNHHFEEIP